MDNSTEFRKHVRATLDPAACEPGTLSQSQALGAILADLGYGTEPAETVAHRLLRVFRFEERRQTAPLAAGLILQAVQTTTDPGLAANLLAEYVRVSDGLDPLDNGLSLPAGVM